MVTLSWRRIQHPIQLWATPLRDGAARGSGALTALCRGVTTRPRRDLPESVNGRYGRHSRHRCVPLPRPQPSPRGLHATGSRAHVGGLRTRHPFRVSAGQHEPAKDTPGFVLVPSPSAMLPHDAACKLLFSFPAMVRDLLARVRPPESGPKRSTSPHWSAGPRAPSATTCDSAIRTGSWRVRFRESVALHPGAVGVPVHCGPDHGGAGSWHTQPCCIRTCCASAPTRSPPVLPIVLYHGRERWTRARGGGGVGAAVWCVSRTLPAGAEVLSARHRWLY